MLPMYLAIPVNILGFSLLLTVRYFWGRRFGAGNAWRMICKTDTLKKLIQQDGKGNPALLILLRLLPCMPINTFSNIYGSFDFGYRKFMLLSIIGFMPRLLSFTFVGRNVFDPLAGLPRAADADILPLGHLLPLGQRGMGGRREDSCLCP